MTNGAYSILAWALVLVATLAVSRLVSHGQRRSNVSRQEDA